jgi:hypothetical protein
MYVADSVRVEEAGRLEPGVDGSPTSYADHRLAAIREPEEVNLRAHDEDGKAALGVLKPGRRGERRPAVLEPIP